MGIGPVIILAFLGFAGQRALESGGVRIAATLESQVYTWTVTNLAAPAISSFEVGTSKTYLYTVPDGWTWEHQGERFVARTAEPLRAIAPGQSRSFTARVSSAGAALGAVRAVVGFDGGGDTVAFEGVWGPVPKRRSMVALVVTTLSAIAVAHTIARRPK
jgi:hypothetical protein